MKKNTELSGLIIGVVIILLSLCGGVSPFIFSLDMMEWGYGTICLSGFFFTLGVITFVMYLYRFLTLESIFSGENLLVHWTYPNEKYKKEVEKTLKETKSRNFFLLGIVIFFFVLFTSLFAIFGFATGDGDDMVLFVVMMLSILGIISFFALFMPYFYYWQAKKTTPEVYISKKGMFYMGQLHTWNKPLFILENVEITDKKDELIFHIKYFTKLGWYKYDDYTVKVPIPEGEVEKGEKTVRELRYK